MRDAHPNAPTLADLLSDGHRLEIWCSGCHRWTMMQPAKAVAKLGAVTTYPAASRRLRCSTCGARGRDGMVSARPSIEDRYEAMRRAGIGLP